MTHATVVQRVYAQEYVRPFCALSIPRKHFGDSWRQYLPIAIERLWRIIAIMYVRIFVRYFVKSYANNTALKRFSINRHFLWVRTSRHRQVNRYSINEHIYSGDFPSKSHQFMGNIEGRLLSKIFFVNPKKPQLLCPFFEWFEKELQRMLIVYNFVP